MYEELNFVKKCDIHSSSLWLINNTEVVNIG
jgi:hypothetical protein